MFSGRSLHEFQKRLLDWFTQFQRDLPWRRDADPYRVWLSEIMLQQTRVAAVIPYYERFLERFPTIRALAEAPEEEVLRFWSGLGYYSRARNLQQAARQIVEKHGGIFPENEADVLALPGVGRYTAAAIMSIAFGATRAVLDGNVARVLARLGAIRGDLRQQERWQSLQESANHLLEPSSPGAWNQAMMELGAMVCLPRAPQCLLCPVSAFCEGRKLGIAASLPQKQRKRKPVELTLAATILLDRQQRTLLIPRESATQEEVAALVSKLWHFPTVAVRKNPASEVRALLRKLFPKLTALQLIELPVLRHTVTFRKISLRCFVVLVSKLPKIPNVKSMVLTEVAAPSSLAISNLTRKAALAALEESKAAKRR